MAIEWWSTALAFAGGIPTAIAAIAGVSEGIKKGSEMLNDRRMRKELRHGPEELRGFYVKTTHVKYVIREDSSEVTKLRTVRALQEINSIALDHLPEVMRDTMRPKPGPVSPDFFAIPGVALLREDRFLVSLAADQVFRAGQDHLYVLVYKIPSRVDQLFENPEREFITVLRPLGTESLTVEIHFPPSRDLKHNEDGTAALELHEIREGNRTPLAATRYKINAQARIRVLTQAGNETDMFRLTILKPPQNADIEIAWHWSRRTEHQ